MIILALIFSLHAFAVEVADKPMIQDHMRPSDQMLNAGAIIQLPACVNDKDTLDKVASRIKANAATKFKFSVYEKILPPESDRILTARLIYAETLAARCPAANDAIVNDIAAVVNNRIRIRHDAKAVIFQKDQFNSSLATYGESKPNLNDGSLYKEFLCPTQENAKLWQQAYALAGGANAHALQPDATNYFLYKHSPRWTQPHWSLPEDPKSATASPDVRACIKVFDDAKFR